MRNIDEQIIVNPEKSIKMIDIFFYSSMKATGVITDHFIESVCTVTSSLLLYFGLH